MQERSNAPPEHEQCDHMVLCHFHFWSDVLVQHMFFYWLQLAKMIWFNASRDGFLLRLDACSTLFLLHFFVVFASVLVSSFALDPCMLLYVFNESSNIFIEGLII